MVRRGLRRRTSALTSKEDEQIKKTLSSGHAGALFVIDGTHLFFHKHNRCNPVALVESIRALSTSRIKVFRVSPVSSDVKELVEVIDDVNVMKHVINGETLTFPRDHTPAVLILLRVLFRYSDEAPFLFAPKM